MSRENCLHHTISNIEQTEFATRQKGNKLKLGLVGAAGLIALGFASHHVIIYQGKIVYDPQDVGSIPASAYGEPVHNVFTSKPQSIPPHPTPASSAPKSSYVEYPIPELRLNSEGNGDAPLSKSEYYLDSWGPYFNQRDPAWYYQALGNSRVKLGSEGCVVTDLAMVWDHLTGKNYGPQTVNAHKEWFIGQYLKYWPVLNGHRPVDFSKPDGMNEAQYNDFLKEKIREGYSLIIQVPNGHPNAWHYVVGHGVDSNGSIIINDPWYAWNVDVAGDWHWGTGMQGVMNATWAVGYK